MSVGPALGRVDVTCGFSTRAMPSKPRAFACATGVIWSRRAELTSAPAATSTRTVSSIACGAIAEDPASCRAVQPRLLTWSTCTPARISRASDVGMASIRGTDEAGAVVGILGVDFSAVVQGEVEEVGETLAGRDQVRTLPVSSWALTSAPRPIRLRALLRLLSQRPR